MKTADKIRATLTGFQEADASSSGNVSLLTGIADPPSYMVMFLLFGVMRFRRGSGDKSAWTTSIRFRGVVFLLHDWKRSTWSIRAEEDCANARVLANEIKGKIQRAAKI